MYIMGKEEVEAVQQVIESGQLFRYQPGVESITDKLEKELSQKFGVNHAIALSSGTASLITALAGMGIGPGDEVIVPAYTFMATALAPLAVGAVPVLAEIDQSLTIDPSNAEKKITPNTKAIIPVHMCGLSCDMTAIMQLAQKHNLLVLEDAAQACGGSYQGQALGTIGDVGAFSFNSHKIISCGEGGAIITNQVEFFQRSLIHHDGGCAFRDHKLDIPFFAGLNFRTNDILSAILRVQFSRLDGILEALRAEKSYLMDELAGIPAFQFNPIHDMAGDCATTLALFFDSADLARNFAEKLTDSGIRAKRPIDSDRHVYINWEPVLQQHGAHHPARDGFLLRPEPITYSKDMCPQTLQVLEQTVFLSMQVNRTAEEQEQIVKSVKNQQF